MNPAPNPNLCAIIHHIATRIDSGAWVLDPLGVDLESNTCDVRVRLRKNGREVEFAHAASFFDAFADGATALCNRADEAYALLSGAP